MLTTILVVGALFVIYGVVRAKTGCSENCGRCSRGCGSSESHHD
jgi:hypothetical protein